MMIPTDYGIAAKATGVSRGFGTLESGKLADLILVEGDPIATIDDPQDVGASWIFSFETDK